MSDKEKLGNRNKSPRGRDSPSGSGSETRAVEQAEQGGGSIAASIRGIMFGTSSTNPTSIPIRERDQTSSFSLKFPANPFTRHFISPQGKQTGESDEIGQALEGTNKGGLLSNPQQINTRPVLEDVRRSLLPPREDYDMMDNDPSTKSRLEEIREALERSKHLHPGLKKPPFVAVIIDADQLLFQPEFIQMGEKGALQALDLIKSNINRDLKTHLTVEDVRIHCYCNLRGLLNFVTRISDIEKDEFHSFLNMIRSSAPFNIFTSAGEGNQAADKKVKAYLTEFIHDDSCLQIYLGGLGDYGYRDDLNAIREFGLLHRIRLLNIPQFTTVSLHYSDYSNRMVDWGEEVFILSDDFSEHHSTGEGGFLKKDEHRLQRIQALYEESRISPKNLHWFANLQKQNQGRMSSSLLEWIRKLEEKIAAEQKRGGRIR
ncbi:hypothetical protein CBS101457_005276 [Exobasidium rhododendri]|nr:hypothetical protein CBS101457_005276 [Exobasidium rhododendri]